jgi:glycosyltransferase involved in cell wall biosynthesis
MTPPLPSMHETALSRSGAPIMRTLGDFGAPGAQPRRAEPPVDMISPRVVHAIGRLTDSVFRFVGPAVESLRQAGARQVVLAIEDPGNTHLFERFHPDIEVIVVKKPRGAIRGWRRWLAAYRAIRRDGEIDILHLHGFVPSALVASMVGRRRIGRVLYSPHGSKAHHGETMWHRLAGGMAEPLVRRLQHRSLAYAPSDASRLSRWGRSSHVEVLDAPLDPAFLAVRHQPAERALVVGGVLDAPGASVSAFTQVAVLLAHGEHNGPTLEWVGACDDACEQVLGAAGVCVHADRSAAFRAERLARAWVFVSPSATHGFAGHIVEAMACGAPIVAFDSRQHRDLVEDGQTGYLCRSVEELCQRVIMLLDQPELRTAMGERARVVAMRRFGDGSFEQELLMAYRSAAAHHRTGN